jgi:protein SCO1/2
VTASRDFPLRGVVVALDPDTARVTVRHEAIPDFMPAMTMPLTLADPAQLADLAPGDTITATLRVDATGSRLHDVEVTGLPAEPPPVAPAIPLLQPGDLVPDITLTTQDGQSLTLSDLRGKVVILTFIYTRCPLPEFCPRQDAQFAELARRVAQVPARADRVRLLSISMDPEHDTPEVLRRHASLRGAKPPLWTFAVASHEALGTFGPPFGLVYSSSTAGEIIHSLSTAMIGTDGRLIRLERGEHWTADSLFPDLVRATNRPDSP